MPAITQALLAQYVELCVRSKTIEIEKRRLRRKLLDLHDAHAEVQAGRLFLRVAESMHLRFSHKDLQLHLGTETFEWLRQQIARRTTRVVKVTGKNVVTVLQEDSDEFLV